MSTASRSESAISGFDPVLDDVIEEIANKIQAGEPVDGEAILARYPERADSIRRLLPAMEVMAEFGVSASRLAAEGVSPGLSPLTGELGILGDFRILREVGRGGMGIVYEAEQISLSRRVALKVLPFAGAMDSHQLRRFRTEAQAAAQLHHTNIVPVFWIGSEQGVHYYAMQFIEGRTLADVIRELRQLEGKDRRDGTPGNGTAPGDPAASALASAITAEFPPPAAREGVAPPAEAPGPTGPTAGPTPAPPSGSSTRDRAYFRNVARLGMEAAEALEHAHQEGIVHRDVKPANLMIDARGHLWITDFGLARLQSDSGLTITGDLLGTLRYMSPEQALGQRGYLDHRTDIYSLGVTLCELLTLEPAFGSRDRAELLRRIAEDEPRAPRRLDGSIPRELETIVLKAMDKVPSGRYQSAQELADDLRRFLEHRPIRARRPTVLERAAKWTRRHSMVVVAGVLFLVLSVAVLSLSTVMIVRQQQEATHQRDEARRQRQNARQAVDRMYTRVAEEWIAKQPKLEPLQREFLLEALRFYQDFSGDEGKEPAEILGRAIAYRRVGRIQQAMGQKAEAEQVYRHAQQLLDDLVTRYPAVSEYRREQAHNYGSLEALFQGTDRLAEAEWAIGRELAIREALCRQNPAAFYDARELAATCANLGILLRSRSQFLDAERALRRAEELAKPLVAERPGDVAGRTLLGGTYRAMAILMDVDGSGRTEEARSFHRKAIDISESLVKEFPRDYGYRQTLMANLNNLAVMLQGLGRYADSEPLLGRARELAQENEVQFPDILSHKVDLAQVCSNLGIAFKETGRLREAAEAHRHALLIAKTLLDCQPDAPQYHSNVGAYSHNLANALLEQGKLRDARRLFEDAVHHQKAALEVNPRQPTYRRFLSNHFNGLVGVLGMLGETDAARPIVEQWSSLLQVQDLIRGTSEGSRADANGLIHLARVLAISPLAPLRDPRLAVRIAEKVAGWAPESGYCWNTLGVARYRVGDWEAAIGSLEKSMQLSDGGGPTDWLFLAMALGQRGDKEKARVWYDKAVTSMEQNKSRDGELSRFLAEAAAPLGLTGDRELTGKKEASDPQRSKPCSPGSPSSPSDELENPSRRDGSRS